MSQNSLANIRVVLVRTFHPGNIGAAARAAKTMGLQNLHLVAPREFPHEDAMRMAAGADDLIVNARVHERLDTAVADCRLVIACTARPRSYDLPALDAAATAHIANQHAANAPVAILFGPERMGLRNDDLRQAHYRLTIPANPEYASLNLAAAVQIVSYELHKAKLVHALSGQQPPKKRSSEHTKYIAPSVPPAPLPNPVEFEQLVCALAQLLRQVSFLRPHEGESMARLANFLRRAQPTQADMNILRGAIKKISKRLDQQTPT